MLKLQRASAGSGKTYTLTKTFILNYISQPKSDNPGEKRRILLSREQLHESLRSILAITFTNKATDEMKKRIVEKLHALAWSKLPDNKVDYLNEFMQCYGWSRTEIATTCRAALDIILDDYSSFNVSTIDSFFQKVLRTFTYETNINNAYSVVIDSNEVALAGLNETINSIDSVEFSKNPVYQSLRRNMMESARMGNNWNIFTRITSRGSFFNNILGEIKNLESEKFKEIRGLLFDYFSKNRDFISLVKTLEDIYEPKQLTGKINAEAKKLHLICSRSLFDFKVGNRKLSKFAENLSAADLKIDDIQPFDVDKMKACYKVDTKNKFPVSETPEGDEILRLTQSLNELREKLASYFASLNPEMRGLWPALSKTLPSLQLIVEVARKASEILEENDMVQLSDTNTMLSEIISDSETPFIYERLGTRLQHFLIDEFQDTSRLQWKNLTPLVKQSESQNFDNLIIGDAKQSIYRFRNAAPELITTEVQQQFDNVLPAGNSKADNANHRSAHEIVKFNNLFFEKYSEKLQEASGENDYFSTPYSNTVQFPAAKEKAGYVQLRVYPNTVEAADAIDDENSGDFPDFMKQIPSMIEDMLRRGYHQNDIAVIASKNKELTDTVKAIIDYNNRLAEGCAPINFVSNESLKLKESPAVKIIISALDTIARGVKTTPEDESDNDDNVADGNKNSQDKEEDNKRRKINWYEVSNEYNFFAAQHPEMSPATRIQEFLKQPADMSMINTILKGLPTLTLPAMVEGMVEFLLPEELQKSEAAYIGALQDCILTYCSANPADAASFLRYWTTVEDKISITSPEDADAVQLMTVHKSKGLEFKCVIVVAGSMTEKRSAEWAWISTDLMHQAHPELNFPPFVPIEVSEKNLLSTSLSDLSLRLKLEKQMDMLNMAYVAFTRAVNELYILIPYSAKPGTSPKAFIQHDFITHLKKDNNLFESLNNTADTDSVELRTNPHNVKIENEDTENMIIHIGEKYATAPVKEKKAAEVVMPQTSTVDGYKSFASSCLMTFRPGLHDSALVPLDESEKNVDENPDDDDTNPRAFGTLMHSLLEDIYTPADLPRALRRMKISGRMTPRQLTEASSLLSKAMTHTEAKRWFAGEMKIENERTILRKNEKNSRPDRIVIHPDGEVEIVDYKFGLSHSQSSLKRYKNQVKEYAKDLRQAGFSGKMRGWLWFIRQEKIEEVSVD